MVQKASEQGLHNLRFLSLKLNEKTQYTTVSERLIDCINNLYRDEFLSLKFQALTGAYDSYWHYHTILPTPVVASTFRLIPKATSGTGLGMRFELVGCSISGGVQMLGELD